MVDGPQGSLAGAISLELAACRNRGIERLDVHSHNQVPVRAPELQRLAEEYAAAMKFHVPRRAGKIKYLLRDALRAFTANNEADARLVSALFFGDSQDRVTKSAGELLDIARTEFESTSEVRFREARHDAFDSFAAFIPGFVANVGSQAPAAEETAGNTVIGELAAMPGNSVHDVPAPEVQRHVATTGYIDNSEHFVRLLSEAMRVTIVGFTNERLASMLRTALARKRAAMLWQDGCWDSIRIVFLSDDLLESVNDERQYPDPDEALLLRRRASVHGRRTVSVFLRSLPTARWAIYDSPYFPPLIGTLFEMTDGRRIVQMLIRRPQRNASDHLYLELEDTRGHYFSNTFEEIVHGSIDDNKVVPVGVYLDDRLRVTGSRFRQQVLIDGSQATGWLPLVLVVTWQIREGQPQPLLQLRTPLNAIRELGHLSHLAGHVTPDELPRPGTELQLGHEAPLAAARRRVQVETVERDVGELKPLATSTYLHPDKEHLFFFIYSCQLPEAFQLWRQAEMHPVSIQELLDIRENQALRKALSLCESPLASRRLRASAFELAALNLMLHGHAGLAQRLQDAASQAARTDDLAAEIRALEEQSRQTWLGLEDEVEVKGLSGLQYREFFSILLPFYASVGVPGAAERLRLITDDDNRRAALTRLSQLYHDEILMAAIPLEL